MPTPDPNDAVLADPPSADTAPTASRGAAPPLASGCPAWDDQEIDTAGTEADLWFPRSDAGA